MNTNEILRKLDNREAEICVIGLGYVGLPLAIAFATQFRVIGYDKDEAVVEGLLKNVSHIRDVSERKLKEVINISFFPTTLDSKIRNCHVYIICVPTPLTWEKEPDLSYVKAAGETISKILTEGKFVVLESTTYPGTTEEVLVPILEKSGLEAGTDFGVAFSPERIDPGNQRFTIQNTPKIVGGLSENCTEIACRLYESICEKVVPVSNCRTAEACKMLENIYRNTNIALVNEMALIFEKIGIDIWETINAASTKPYGFMPFYPGPGIGGHCIPLDPYYMSYRARRAGFIPRFIELSGNFNDFMKTHVINLVEKGLAIEGKRIHGARIAVLGLAYKKNSDDVRESPAEKIITDLGGLGGCLKVYDPYVEMIETKAGQFKSEETIADTLTEAECAVFLVDHSEFVALSPVIMRKLMVSPIVIDCKNVFEPERMEGITYLGLGKPL